MRVTEEQDRRLREIGEFLRTAPRLHVAVVDTTPRPGSQAEKDFTADVFCEVSAPGTIATPWPREILKDPRGLAVNLTHQAANHIEALGVLYENGVVQDAPGTLTRAAFEYISRAVWILDPNVDLRARCARQQLTDLKSFDEGRKARKLAIPPDRRDAASKRMTKVRRRVIDTLTQRFATTIDPSGKLVLPREKGGFPILAGERYLSFTEVAERYGSATGLPVSGAELYDYLAGLAHPQGFTSFNGVLADRGDGVVQRYVSYANLERLAGVIAAACRRTLKNDPLWYSES